MPRETEAFWRSTGLAGRTSAVQGPRGGEDQAVHLPSLFCPALKPSGNWLLRTGGNKCCEDKCILPSQSGRIPSWYREHGLRAQLAAHSRTSTQMQRFEVRAMKPLTFWHFLQNQPQWFCHQFSKEDGDSVVSVLTLREVESHAQDTQQM